MYIVGLYPEFRMKLADGEGQASWGGRTLYYVQKTKKHVFWNSLLQFRGTDASNLFDEEIPESEQAFSGDEDEKNYKRLVKKIRQKTRLHRQESEERKTERGPKPQRR